VKFLSCEWLDLPCVLAAWANEESRTSNPISLVTADAADGLFIFDENGHLKLKYDKTVRGKSMLHVFILYCMMLMYDHQLMSSKGNTDLLLPHPQRLGMKSWRFLLIQKGEIE
jgi:hypothetical protein